MHRKKEKEESSSIDTEVVQDSLVVKGKVDNMEW
jgi:hypothetical protein